MMEIKQEWLCRTILAVFSCIAIYAFYWTWVIPINRIRTWHQIGYKHVVESSDPKVKITIFLHLKILNLYHEYVLDFEIRNYGCF